METFSFESGVKEFEVNGSTVLKFNPTDSEFISRLFDAFDTLDKKQDSYKSEVERTANKREIFDTAKKMDAEMREIIDAAFGDPVCDSLFGKMNVYALGNGLPVWCNFMLAVMDQIDTTFAREQKLTNPRIAKYTAKYKK